MPAAPNERGDRPSQPTDFCNKIGTKADIRLKPDYIRLQGKTGSHGQTAKMTRLTRGGHWLMR